MSTTGEQLATAGQTAAAYIERKWGGPSRVLPLVFVSVSATGTRILQNNPRRMEYLILNPGVAGVSIGNTITDSQTGSFIIPSRGGSFVSLIDEDGEFVTYELWASTLGAVVNVGVLEIIRK